MANIVEYFAKGKITPDDKGFSAQENAARRIGSLAEQGARDRSKQLDLERLVEQNGVEPHRRFTCRGIAKRGHEDDGDLALFRAQTGDD